MRGNVATCSPARGRVAGIENAWSARFPASALRARKLIRMGARSCLAFQPVSQPTILGSSERAVGGSVRAKPWLAESGGGAAPCMIHIGVQRQLSIFFCNGPAMVCNGPAAACNGLQWPAMTLQQPAMTLQQPAMTCSLPWPAMALQQAAMACNGPAAACNGLQRLCSSLQLPATALQQPAMA
eukprot:gene23083-biopygen8827